MDRIKPGKRELSVIKFKKACARMLTPKPNRAGKYNFTILSLAGLTTAACNSATDDQCYGGLGIIAGSFCARQNDVIKDDRVVLKTVSSTDVYELTAGLDADGNSLVDAVEFTKAADVTGTKYTLSSGDILKNPGKVSLSLINTGSMDGQSIFGAKEIEISTQGTTVILATEWVNNDLITVKNADQSVTLNNLQATRLDSAAAENNNFYPGTAYRVEDIKAPNETITYFFNEDASIPDSGTTYYGYSGAVKCLSEGVGDVAFAKDSTVDGYCGNENASLNEDWCLPRDEYVALPAFGQAPSHPVMYNPEKINVQTRTAILNALLALNNEMYVVDYEMQGETYTGCYNIITHQVDSESNENACGGNILANVLGTPGLVEANTQEHLGSYSSLIAAIPGISTYYDTKYEISG